MRAIVTAATGLAIAAGIYISAPAHAAEISLLPETGGKIAVFEGKIEGLDNLHLRKFLADHKQLDTLILSSPGGEADEGDELAETIRTAHLKTVIYDYCASSCFTLFAAGTDRVALDGALLGVHSAATQNGETNDKTEKVTDRMIKDLIKYGIPQAIIDVLKSTKQPEIHWLTADEEKSMGIRIVNE